MLLWFVILFNSYSLNLNISFHKFSNLNELNRSITITNIVDNTLNFYPTISTNELVGELETTLRPSIFSALDYNKNIMYVFISYSSKQNKIVDSSLFYIWEL